ncbi:MAG: hypothetical protein K940chlam1_00926 [Candidatus Anoxychlamydiales bacterium]|nr:hypothetical protein [Candidatus Anoxychlamydiales bacterium]NGX35679.1 hypothetical protein [Candidatus Anoxychlamydiales bacterium]
MDDVLLNKIATIEKCIKRINEEYTGFEKEIETNYTKQDAIILNLQRACEASIDLAARLIRLNNLGIPQKTRDVFIVLEESKIISKSLSQRLQKMVGFRNIAVHDYKSLNLAIVKSIIEKNLNDFLDFTKLILEKYSK